MSRLRVLVAEDSPTARTLLLEMLARDPSIDVVGTAMNGIEAVRMTEELRPDLVTMDVHMPGMDGLEATREIMTRVPTPILIVSSAARRDAALSLSATEAGALMVVPKPEGPGAVDFEQQRDYLLRMVHAMAGVRLVRRWAPRPTPTNGLPPKPRSSPVGRPRVVALAASTGGPAAVRRILQMLPGEFPLPLLIVQHIARGFTPGLVDWLALGSGPRVRVAEAGEPLLGGVAYLAPDDRHLGIGPQFTVDLSPAPPIGQFRPSATYLFRSVNAAVQGAAIGAILTGMGDDGVAGLLELRRSGGYVIAQDEATSVVFGMAREAVRAGIVDEVLPIADIAPRLTQLVQERAHG